MKRIILGYIDRLPIRVQSRHERVMFSCKLTLTQTMAQHGDKLVIDVDTHEEVVRVGDRKKVSKDHLILHVIHFFVLAMQRRENLTMEDHRYTYTLVSVYENGCYQPLKG